MLPNVMSLEYRERWERSECEEKDKAVQISQGKLIDQIHGLTGSKPKIEWDKEEQRYAIYEHVD